MLNVYSGPHMNSTRVQAHERAGNRRADFSRNCAIETAVLRALTQLAAKQQFMAVQIRLSVQTDAAACCERRATLTFGTAVKASIGFSEKPQTSAANMSSFVTNMLGLRNQQSSFSHEKHTDNVC
jgi:hypothetical protein